MNKMVGIVKYYIENRRTSRGIIVVVPLDGTKTVSKLKIGKASLKRGEDVFDGDIVSFELERNDNDCLVNNVTKAVHDENFLDILQDRSFQGNYIHIKNFIFNYDSYAYQNFKKAVSSLVSDEMAEKEVVVWPELNPKKIETFIPKRYAGSDNHQGTYDSDKKLFEGVNAEKWFRIRYFPYIPKEVLQNNRSMWKDLDEKTAINFLIAESTDHNKMDACIKEISSLCWFDSKMIYKLKEYPAFVKAILSYIVSELNAKRVEAEKGKVYEDFRMKSQRKRYLRYIEMILAILRLREDPDFDLLIVDSKEANSLAETIRIVDDYLGNPVSKIKLKVNKPQALCNMSDIAFAIDMYLTGDEGVDLIEVVSVDME